MSKVYKKKNIKDIQINLIKDNQFLLYVDENSYLSVIDNSGEYRALQKNKFETIKINGFHSVFLNPKNIVLDGSGQTDIYFENWQNGDESIIVVDTSLIQISFMNDISFTDEDISNSDNEKFYVISIKKYGDKYFSKVEFSTKSFGSDENPEPESYSSSTSSTSKPSTSKPSTSISSPSYSSPSYSSSTPSISKPSTSKPSTSKPSTSDTSKLIFEFIEPYVFEMYKGETKTFAIDYRLSGGTIESVYVSSPYTSAVSIDKNLNLTINSSTIDEKDSNIQVEVVVKNDETKEKISISQNFICRLKRKIIAPSPQYRSVYENNPGIAIELDAYYIDYNNERKFSELTFKVKNSNMLKSLVSTSSDGRFYFYGETGDKDAGNYSATINVSLGDEDSVDVILNLTVLEDSIVEQ